MQDPFSHLPVRGLIANVEVIQEIAHKVNLANGWWEEREFVQKELSHFMDNTPHMAIELLGLVTSEISEAMEAARKHPRSQWGDAKTKDTMVREMGGAIVRLMDLAEHLQLPLGAAVIEEIRHNATRGYRHGGRAA